MGRLERFMKKRGLLLAAGLCVVAAGAAGIGAINGLIDTLSTEQRAPAQDQPKAQEDETAWQMEEIAETPVAKPESGVAKEPASSSQPSAQRRPQGAQPSSSTAAQNAAGSGQSAAPAAPSPRFARPVAGEVTEHFSGTELLYNETMGDWRTHNGTDFAAAYGETVRSVTSGTVTSVKESVLWGWTVEVEGSDGLVRYTGLSHKPAVKEGQAVTAGDTIGKLDELDAEIAQDPHLHVEYEKDGKLQDLMTLLTG